MLRQKIHSILPYLATVATSKHQISNFTQLSNLATEPKLNNYSGRLACRFLAGQTQNIPSLLFFSERFGSIMIVTQSLRSGTSRDDPSNATFNVNSYFEYQQQQAGLAKTPVPILVTRIAQEVMSDMYSIINPYVEKLKDKAIENIHTRLDLKFDQFYLVTAYQEGPSYDTLLVLCASFLASVCCL